MVECTTHLWHAKAEFIQPCTETAATLQNISQHNNNLNYFAMYVNSSIYTVQHLTKLVATNLNCVNVMKNMGQHCYKICFNPHISTFT